MAMKFWFGKKGTEQDGGEVPSHDTPVVTQNPLAGSASPASEAETLFAEPQWPDAISSPETVSEAEGVKQGVEVPAPAVEPPVKLQGGNVDGISEKPKPATLTLKAVGGSGPVRLAPRPSEAVQQTGEAVQATGAGRSVFGLRPKTEQTPPGPEEKKEAAAGSENDLLRPTTDQRALYYELMNGLYDAILILDDQGHVVDCSKRITDLLGYAREDAWDLPIDKIITGMSVQMFAHLRRNLAENHHILIDARCFRQDGTSFAGEVGVSTLSLTRGHNIVFAIRNVERRKNAMDDLRRGQAAFDVALVPAFVCDTDGFFQIVNQAFLDSFGIPDASQAKSVRFVDLLPDAARLFLRASCGEKMREKLNVSTANGQTVKLELSLAPVQSGQNTTGVAGSILQI